MILNWTVDNQKLLNRSRGAVAEEIFFSVDAVEVVEVAADNLCTCHHDSAAVEVVAAAVDHTCARHHDNAAVEVVAEADNHGSDPCHICDDAPTHACHDAHLPSHDQECICP